LFFKNKYFGKLIERWGRKAYESKVNILWWSSCNFLCDWVYIRFTQLF